MNTPDKDTVLKAMEDARRILGEYIAPGPRDATQTVHRLLAVLRPRCRSHETAPDYAARGIDVLTGQESPAVIYGRRRNANAI